MATIVERTPRRVTVSMSARRWNRLQQLEEADRRQKSAKPQRNYRHEALCGMLKSDATQTELIEDYLTEKYNL